MIHLPQEITKFEKILNKFYDRIEKDENFFNYYNVDIEEAKKLLKIVQKIIYANHLMKYLAFLGLILIFQIMMMN